MKKKYLISILLCVIPCFTAFSQVKINEILASNSSVNSDPDYGANADWVELYNAGNTAVNLNGYFITDNLSNPQKYKISKDVNIPAKGYLVIWCDDKATGLHTNFKLSASGEEIGLYDATLTPVDTLVFGAQYIDISYGRCPDGGDKWMFYAPPTPAASNDTTGYAGQVKNFPIFPLPGGLFDAPVSVELFNDLGGIIRYTLDGSEPTEESPVYTNALQIAKTTVVRARIFKQGYLAGPVITNTYFINEGFEKRNLPVVSLVSDSTNFWGAQKGIYVQNFKPDWEIPVNIELFENNGSDRAAFSERAGVKINGLYSWQLPQKMLGVYFSKQYGSSSLAYKLFFDRSRSNFKDFALRASGNDWSNTLFRDGLIQQACHNFNMKLDNMAFRPCVVYFNGKYMGIHNMREKVDEDYIASNYNLSKDSFDIIENEDYVETGSLDAYTAFKSLYSKDLSVAANYDAVANAMNIENFSDLMATEIYSGNSSIDHNVMAWKPKNEGKWKWILMDLDRGMFSSANSNNLISFYKNQTVWPFSQLLKNANYKKYFGTRLANHLYTTYNPIRMKKRIDYHKGLIEAEIPNHVARWLGATSSYGDAMPSVEYWYNEVSELKTFAEERPSVLLTDLENYGFSAPAQLSLSVYPSTAGNLTFNGMTVLDPQWTGYYPTNLPITLKAISKPGYTVKGWAKTIGTDLVSKQSTWKYLDNGTDQGIAWYAPGFDDASWSTGAGKFGYGDVQQTKINYGSNSNNKYVTTYFRKTVEVPADVKANAGFMINLLCDDGAVVYLNGKEIIRSNMPAGTTTYKTLASTSVNGAAETTYSNFFVDGADVLAGTNVLAVEIHQNTVSSSDLGFDLEWQALMPETANLVSTTDSLQLTLTGNEQYTAVYEANGQSIIPATISQNLTLYKNQSPYVVQGDVTIPEQVTLTIEPGVVIYMAPKACFIVHGNMLANGTADDPIKFTLNPDYTKTSWGALCFINTTDTTRMRYVTIEHASNGPDLYNAVAAISGYKTNLILDHMTLTDVDKNPIATRYSYLAVTNSAFHIKITGDMINVKYGKADIVSNVFEGNDMPDTDAIDFDDVNDGHISQVKIHNLLGSNSDGIDLGEAKGTRIDSVLIYNITDKCISVGLRTNVVVTNGTFMNATLGFGVKDSSHIEANRCTFYGIADPVACYEKIAGRSGGNAIVTNSILSNSYDHSYTSDDKSTCYFSHSVSDNDALPDGHANVFGNPGFDAPGLLDFGLKETSPARLTGWDNGTPVDMGSTAKQLPITIEPQIAISEIFYNLNKDANRTEFVALYNPGTETVHLGGYSLSKAIKYTFPIGTMIEPGKRVFVVKDLLNQPQLTSNAAVFVWQDGSLANEGETIRLCDSMGLVIDQVVYSPSSPWPNVSGNDERVLSLVSADLDNHLPESWTTRSYDALLNGLSQQGTSEFKLYPNPTYGPVTIHLENDRSEKMALYSVTGQLVYSTTVENGQTVDLSHLSGQVLLAKIGKHIGKIVVLSR
ncbi:MAG: lamin tail domain-containing protein [Bacteroidota bacterium]|nr:lamin tail domain-containing protein [Bacteroidota bacterium]